MQEFNKTFIALLKEAEFTKEMLCSGATQIRQANYASKGMYFQAFTSLSTGLERIGKLCLILDYYLCHNGKFPDSNYMKKEIGHDIGLIYEKSRIVVERHSITFMHERELYRSFHKAMIEVLSGFAKGDRYSNIDILVGGRQSDPIKMWIDKVDSPIFDACVGPRKKQQIDFNAALGERLMGGYSDVLHISETGDELTEVGKASQATGRYEAVAPYRQLYILQIIRYWVELLNALGCLAQQKSRTDIPFFSEIFGIFNNEDSYLKTRKNFG